MTVLDLYLRLSEHWWFRVFMSYSRFQMYCDYKERILPNSPEADEDAARQLQVDAAVIAKVAGRKPAIDPGYNPDVSYQQTKVVPPPIDWRLT